MRGTGAFSRLPLLRRARVRGARVRGARRRRAWRRSAPGARDPRATARWGTDRSSSSPAPNIRTVCAQASGGAPNTVCTSSCRTTRSVGSRPSAPGAGMPVSTSRPPRRSSPAAVRAASADPAVSITTSTSSGSGRSLVRKSVAPNRRDSASRSSRVPTTSSSAGEAALRNCTANIPSVPVPTTATRSPGTARAFSAAAAMHAAGSSSAAAVRSASSGRGCSSRAGRVSVGAMAPGSVNPVSS